MSVTEPLTGWFSSSEVCERSGISYRVLDYWCAVADVVPHRPAVGSGNPREWSPDDLARLIILARVRDVLGTGRNLHTDSRLVTAVWRFLSPLPPPEVDQMAISRSPLGNWWVGRGAPVLDVPAWTTVRITDVLDVAASGRIDALHGRLLRGTR